MIDHKKLMTKVLQRLAEIPEVSRYIHEQGTASDTWTIQHNMNCFPSVTVVDTAKTVVVGQVDYTDANNLTITFNAAFKGTAFLN